MATGMYVGVNEVLVPEVSGSTTSKDTQTASSGDGAYYYCIDSDPIFESGSTNNTVYTTDGVKNIVTDIFSQNGTYGFYYCAPFTSDPDTIIPVDASKKGAEWYKISNITKVFGNMYSYDETPYTLKLQETTPVIGGPGIARKIKSAYLGIGGVAHKVKKGYVGDSNGKARLFYSSGPKIVLWATGSDEDVAAMITAAHNGDIKLADYWNIGDTRTVNLSAGTNSAGTAIPAQSVELVLAHKPTSTSYYGGGEFIINQKNCLSVSDYMNSTSTNSGSFAGSAMASFLNNSSTGYLAMLPSWLSSVLLDAKVITAQTYSGTTNQTSTHKVFLPATKEVFQGSMNQTENDALEQWDWFKTEANRIKNSSTYNWWWNRSLHEGLRRVKGFIYTNDSGVAGGASANASYGVAPAMLI